MINSDLDNQIFDAILTEALKDRAKAYLSTIPPEEELAKRIQLSDDFIRKMDNLRKDYKRKIARKKRLTYAKKIAASILIIAGLGFGALMMSKPVRATVQNIIIQWLDKYTKFEFQSDSKEIEFKEFTLGYLPEGFEETDYFSAAAHVIIEYKDLIGNELIFEYSLSEGLNIAFDNEYSTHNTIKLNDLDAHLFESDDEDRINYLLWISEGHTFTIGSNLSAEEIIKIAENIVEK